MTRILKNMTRILKNMTRILKNMTGAGETPFFSPLLSRP
jgi:hypothetical protein